MKQVEKQEKKRTQRDYNLGFKLAVVSQVEKGEMTYKQAQNTYGIQGKSTVLVWLRKYGNLDWKKPIIHSMQSPKSNERPAQKIKYLASGEDGNVNIPIVIYAKPFSSSENFMNPTNSIVNGEFQSDIKSSTSYLNNNISVSIPYTGGPTATFIEITSTRLLSILNQYTSLNDVKECKLVITGVNTPDANYNAQINGIPLKITNVNRSGANVTSVSILKTPPSTVTSAPSAVLSQIHIINKNPADANNGGNTTNGLKCYNVYNTQNSDDSVVDSYIEIPNTSIPVEHSKTLRFALEDENNIRPYDFQFTWKITQHQRGTFRNTATTVNPLQNSNLTNLVI